MVVLTKLLEVFNPIKEGMVFCPEADVSPMFVLEFVQL